ncbi:alpha/beta hydrolase [Collinsella sp. zg1085]|uniref:alpha/beta hydrolase n=1 Tax=Collinsella sp. zg1085 TaxID=2844380 RepID=UPI001C0CBD0D|nr:alpha/beta hydrolase [Collinsella sp. zg1085]QWT17964.1 alpha/beta hydrolase [Collinsella sp. zg1085]
MACNAVLEAFEAASALPITVTCGAEETLLPGRDNTCRCKTCIIYLHGGGLLFGSKDDLPLPYRRLMSDYGHTLITLGYPLAPETPAQDLVSVTTHAIESLIRTARNLGYARVVLFGRSAGAWLALQVCARLQRRACDAQIDALWSFYGYPALNEDWLHEPSAAYMALPTVSDAAVAPFLAAAQTGVYRHSYITEADPLTRMQLYIWGRQNGKWLETLGLRSPDEANELSLSPEDIAALPPLFLAASTGDEDVPLGASKRLARGAPYAVMHQVYYLPHDFDRDITRPEGLQAYQAALNFLDSLPNLAATRKTTT